MSTRLSAMPGLRAYGRNSNGRMPDRPVRFLALQGARDFACFGGEDDARGKRRHQGGLAAPAVRDASGTHLAWMAASPPRRRPDIASTAASRYLPSEPDDVVLSARERGQGREEALRQYLTREIDLVLEMATDDTSDFGWSHREPLVATTDRFRCR